MTDIPYLILHKVRGEAAFDIAIRDLDETGWIIPTSGHRAYPARTWRLHDLADISDINKNGCHPAPWACDADIEGLPDHYSSNDRNVQEKSKPDSGKGLALLAKLGLIKPEKRRA